MKSCEKDTVCAHASQERATMGHQSLQLASDTFQSSDVNACIRQGFECHSS